VLFDPQWWRRGEHRVEIDPRDLRPGANQIRLQLSNGSALVSVVWIDVLLSHEAAPGER
jgi:hypothetical protein